MSNLSKMEHFPLLRLPYVALQEVWKPMTPHELINISLVNPTTKQIIETFLRSKRIFKGYVILLKIDKNPKIYIRGSSDFYKYIFTTDQSKAGNTIEDEDWHAIEEYSEDVLPVFWKRSEYILDLFNHGEICVFLDLDAFPTQNKLVINWLLSRKEWIFDCFVECKEAHDEMLDYFLNGLRTPIRLDLKVKVGENFRMKTFPNASYSLFTKDGKWITLQQFLGLKMPKISIRDTQFTNQDMNVFLMKWINKVVHVNLKYMEVYIENPVLEEICVNIPIEQEDIVPYLRGTGYARTNGGFLIRRVDGLTAVVFTMTIVGWPFFAISTY